MRLRSAQAPSLGIKPSPDSRGEIPSAYRFSHWPEEPLYGLEAMPCLQELEDVRKRQRLLLSGEPHGQATPPSQAPTAEQQLQNLMQQQRNLLQQQQQLRLQEQQQREQHQEQLRLQQLEQQHQQLMQQQRQMQQNEQERQRMLVWQQRQLAVQRQLDAQAAQQQHEQVRPPTAMACRLPPVGPSPKHMSTAAFTNV